MTANLIRTKKPAEMFSYAEIFRQVLYFGEKICIFASNNYIYTYNYCLQKCRWIV